MRKFRPLKPPTLAHPIVRRMFDEMNHQQIGILDMAKRSGVNKNTLNDWRTRTTPSVANLAACLTVLGFELKAVRMRDDE